MRFIGAQRFANLFLILVLLGHSVHSRHQVKFKRLDHHIRSTSQLVHKSSKHFVSTREIPLAQGSNFSLEALAEGEDYKCAKHCTCSMIRVFNGKKSEKTTDSIQGSDLIRAKCESPEFTDLLSLDRRTQIIHISLPRDAEQAQIQRPQLADSSTTSFRMPRMIQFNQLREIVIINLKFEVCDSEVFKRGQRLRRLQLNFNHLNRVSKACFKHLDRLIDLNLDRNQLEELESALFNPLLNLRSLSIAHNRLTDLAAHQFANLTHLVSLNLVGNAFKEINLHLLEPMRLSLRMLLLSENEIKNFSHTQSLFMQSKIPASTSNSSSSVLGKSNNINQFAGVLFKNLIKLNIDHNKFERIKSLQLHRFYNVKFLSIRHNNIATIRDKAFNGLKLIELNIAHNKLHTILKCAFCNATIKRLVLSNNNISLSTPVGSNFMLDSPKPVAMAQSTGSELADTSNLMQVVKRDTAVSPDHTQTLQNNMLIISRSVFGPLFNHLEYLDLSSNEYLVDQLELLLEPLLRLEYLNIAYTGLERSLPSPTMFKNLQNMRYLNLSNNELDQLVASTVETLTKLEVLDMSSNKFSELDESFLVTIDELPSMKLINLASNPWLCSQCKVAPLYDWILRSPIYNRTCINQLPVSGVDEEDDASDLHEPDSSKTDRESAENDSSDFYRHDFSLLGLNDDEIKAAGWHKLEAASLDFDLIGQTGLSDQASVSFLGANYNNLVGNLDGNAVNSMTQDFSTSQDDQSIQNTMDLVSSQAEPEVNQNQYLKRTEFCLKCEFPSELRSYNLHELSTGDFRFCAGSAPRFSASEPKIGLTLAIVIILVLFFIIVIVIIVYRKKSNTYYPDELDRLEKGGSSGKKPVLSISSSADQQPFDATDYSSPPMSQSFDSFSTGSQATERVAEDDKEGDEEEEDEEEEEEDEEEDEEEEEDDDEEQLEEDEEIEGGEEDDDEDDQPGGVLVDDVDEEIGNAADETDVPSGSDFEPRSSATNKNLRDQESFDMSTKISKHINQVSGADKIPGKREISHANERQASLTQASNRPPAEDKSSLTLGGGKRSSSRQIESNQSSAKQANHHRPQMDRLEPTSVSASITSFPRSGSREIQTFERVVRTGQNVSKWANERSRSGRRSKRVGKSEGGGHREEDSSIKHEVGNQSTQTSTKSYISSPTRQVAEQANMRRIAMDADSKTSSRIGIKSNSRAETISTVHLSESPALNFLYSSQGDETSLASRRSASQRQQAPIAATRHKLKNSLETTAMQTEEPAKVRLKQNEGFIKPLWTSESVGSDRDFPRINSVDSAENKRLEWSSGRSAEPNPRRLYRSAVSEIPLELEISGQTIEALQVDSNREGESAIDSESLTDWQYAALLASKVESL